MCVLIVNKPVSWYFPCQKQPTLHVGTYHAIKNKPNHHVSHNHQLQDEVGMGDTRTFHRIRISHCWGSHDLHHSQLQFIPDVYERNHLHTWSGVGVGTKVSRRHVHSIVIRGINGAEENIAEIDAQGLRKRKESLNNGLGHL